MAGCTEKRIEYDRYQSGDSHCFVYCGILVNRRRDGSLKIKLDACRRRMAQPERYWRVSQNEIVRFALNNRWLEEQGVLNIDAPAAIAALKNAKPDRMDRVTAVWMVLHYGPEARV